MAEPKKLLVHECKTCPMPFEAQRSTAKNCPPCSLLTRIQYARGKKIKRRECADCGTVFAPLHVQDHYRCAGCTPKTDERVVCVMCEKSAQPVDPRVRICLACAKDPKLRTALLTKLLDEKAKRVKKYSDPAAQRHRVLELWDGDSPTPPVPAPPPTEQLKPYLVAKRYYDEAGLHDLIGSSSKSQATKDEARRILASL